MSTTPRSNGDYISVPNPVTAPPNDSSDITPPDISNSSSSSSAATTTTATATADPDRIAPAPAPATDSDSIAIDMQLSELQKLYDDLVSIVTKPPSQQIPLKSEFQRALMSTYFKPGTDTSSGADASSGTAVSPSADAMSGADASSGTAISSGTAVSPDNDASSVNGATPRSDAIPHHDAMPRTGAMAKCVNGLLTKERANEIRVMGQDDAMMLGESIIQLFVCAVSTGITWPRSGSSEISEHDFFIFMIFLSRKLATGEELGPWEYIMAARIGYIVCSLHDYLDTLFGFEIEVGSKTECFFTSAVYSAFFTTFLAYIIAKRHRDMDQPAHIGQKYHNLDIITRIGLTQDGFKRVLPIIEAEANCRLIPYGKTHCIAYTDISDSMIVFTSDEHAKFVGYDKQEIKDPSLMHGYWLEAVGNDRSILVFRNLKCPGGDECPISCDRVQRVLRYKGGKCKDDKCKGNECKSDECKRAKSKLKKKARKHKPYTPPDTKHGRNEANLFAHRPCIFQSEQEGKYGREDADNPGNADKKIRADNYLVYANQTDKETGLMIPKNYIRNLVSRGVFGFRRLPFMFIWHLFVIGITVLMFLLAFGVIKPSSGSGSAAANSADSNDNGNNTTTAGNIVSSGNVTNFIMRGATYLASNASSFIAVISAAGLPGAFMALTWIRESLYPATTYFELLAAKKAVISFKKACKLKDNCPGCLTAASVRDRVALMFLAFGQYMGLVGTSGTERKEAKACFDCQGSTTCLFRAGMYFIKSFAPFTQNSNEFEPTNDRYQKELPRDCEAWYNYGGYCLARPNKAFLVRRIPEWQLLAMVGYVDILNNEVGRLTYFKEPIIVREVSNPMINFQYLM